MSQLKTICLGVLLSTLYFPSQAQEKPLFSLSFLKEEKSFTYGLNNRRTNLLNDAGTIYGLYAGVSFGGRVQHVLTFNSTLFFIGEEIPNTWNNRAQLTFIGFSEEYFFLQRNFYRLCTYFQVGIGKAIYNNSPAIPVRELGETIFPTEWGLHQEFILWEYLHLKTGGGYRWVLGNPQLPLDGFYYKIGVTVDPKAALSRWKVKKENQN